MNKKGETIIKVLGVICTTLVELGVFKKIANSDTKKGDEKNIDNNYPHQTESLHMLLKNAEYNFINGKYRYALFDARLVLEESLRMVTEINKCEVQDDSIVRYLIVCEDNELIDNNLIEKLHTVRRTCNYNSHEIDCSKITYKKTDYVLKQIKELVCYLDTKIINQKEEALANA